MLRRAAREPRCQAGSEEPLCPLQPDWIDLIGSTFFRSGFSNLRSDQVRSDRVFEIVDPIKFDPIRFLKLSIRSSSIRSGFWDCRSDLIIFDLDRMNF